MTLNVPLAVMLGLKQMTHAQAKNALAKYNLTPEELEAYLKLTAPEEPTFTPHINIRRQTMLVLWLLGGSYRDIGHINSIAHQTVIDYLNKLMSKDERNAARFQVRLGLDKLLIYQRYLREHPELFSTMDPVAIARTLLATVSVED
jgi:hypothetical protein